MSIVTTHSIFCEIEFPGCVGWIGEDVGLSVRTARKVAKLKGWRYKWHKGRYIDVCPQCLCIHW